jgi:hypothetical protein
MCARACCVFGFLRGFQRLMLECHLQRPRRGRAAPGRRQNTHREQAREVRVPDREHRQLVVLRDERHVVLDRHLKLRVWQHDLEDDDRGARGEGEHVAQHALEREPLLIVAEVFACEHR